MNQAVVITSIHGVTKAVRGFLDFSDWHVVLVGDKKTPEIDDERFDNLTYLSIERQKKLAGNLSELPYNHYCRKNLGYQYAIEQGAEKIADTDDDNIPKEDWNVWLSDTDQIRKFSGPRFTNAYKWFTDEFVWPRGLPLDEITKHTQGTTKSQDIDHDSVGVIQGLADTEPDVDAIFRLIFDRKITFDNRSPVLVEQETYSPFNSQNTLWTSSDIYPYMYLPSTVSFRFTDILRGYVAQRGMWPTGKRLAFCGASVRQDRNVHDLMADFESEVPCYLRTKDVVETLQSLTLSGDPSADIKKIYQNLNDNGIVEDRELLFLDRWLNAISE